MDELLKNDLSENALKTRACQERHYLQFCHLYGVNKLSPGNEGIAFYVAHLSNTHKYSSITNYVCGVNYYLSTNRVDGVDYTSMVVYRSLRGAKRLLGNAPLQAMAILPEHLIVMFTYLPRSVGHTAFWAAALCAFRGLLRKSHYTDSKVNLKRGDFVFYDWGMTIHIKASKTIQFSERDVIIPVTRVDNEMLCAVSWVKKHFAEVKAGKKDPAFLIIDGRKKYPISYNLFSDILKMLAEKAKIQATRVSSHGFRRGGATYLARCGVPIDVIKMRGDWKSDQVYKYLARPLEDRVAIDRQVAGLLSNVLK